MKKNILARKMAPLMQIKAKLQAAMMRKTHRSLIII